MFNPFDYQNANGMDPFGVQTAVLGMLSLRNGTNDFSNANFMGQQIQQQQQPQQQQQRNTQLPLTPPGSPGENDRLVVTDSNSKQSPDSSSQHYANGQMNNLSAVQNLDTQFLKREIQSQDGSVGRHMIGNVGTTAGLSELPTTSDPNAMGSAGFNCYSSPHYYSDDNNSMDSSKSPLTLSQSGRRHNRTEKKPIPSELKDDKYFERRKKNNVAAKKSRDTRKRREDDIAMRCAMMEQQNTILRAQLTALREEAASLRHLLLQKRQRQAMQMQNGSQQQIPNMTMG